jgi:Ca2+-binding RTX toxin-like protein
VPGEANAIKAWDSISGLAISDSYTFTLPSSGCFVPSLGVPSRVICPGFTHLVVHLGDGNDTFRLSGPAFTSSVWGGTGIDEEWGGAGSDHLHGEIVHGRLGNDVLHAAQVAYGGPGNDWCIAPVRIGCER